MSEVALYMWGGRGTSEGSGSGEAKNSETRRAIFMGFLIVQHLSSEDVIFDLLQVSGSHVWPAVTLSFLLNKKKKADVFSRTSKKWRRIPNLESEGKGDIGVERRGWQWYRGTSLIRPPPH